MRTAFALQQRAFQQLAVPHGWALTGNGSRLEQQRKVRFDRTQRESTVFPL